MRVRTLWIFQNLKGLRGLARGVVLLQGPARTARLGHALGDAPNAGRGPVGRRGTAPSFPLTTQRAPQDPPRRPRTSSCSFLWFSALITVLMCSVCPLPPPPAAVHNEYCETAEDFLCAFLSLPAVRPLFCSQPSGHQMLPSPAAVHNEYCETPEDFIARRTRLAFLDKLACEQALPRVSGEGNREAGQGGAVACTHFAPGWLRSKRIRMRKSRAQQRLLYRQPSTHSASV